MLILNLGRLVNLRVTSQKSSAKDKKDESAGDKMRVSDLLTFCYQWASLVSCHLPGFIEKLHLRCMFQIRYETFAKRSLLPK